MALVTWQDLCLDALDVDDDVRVLGRRERPRRSPTPSRRPGWAGRPSRHTLWVNPVDRPRRAKNSVHLDVDCASVDDLVALGCDRDRRRRRTPVSAGPGWPTPRATTSARSCAPPTACLTTGSTGSASTAATPRPRPGGGVSCSAPSRRTPAEHDCWTLTGVAVDERMTLDFARVPEPRTEPNRVHWDVAGRRRPPARAGRAAPLGQAGLDRARRPGGQRVLRLPACLGRGERVSEDAGGAPAACGRLP